MNQKLLGKVQFFSKSMLFAATFVLPFAAMMIAIGTVGMNTSLLGGIPYLGHAFAFIGKYMNLAGWVVLGNLPFFFALCVAAALTREKEAGVVIIAGLFYLTFHRILGELSFAYLTMFKDVDTLRTVADLTSQTLNPNHHVLFETVFGIVTMRVGVVGAIIVGALSAHLWNKFKTFGGLPMWLDFFNGARFTVLVTFFYALALACAFVVVWPMVGAGLDFLSSAVETSGSFIAPFFKTFFEVALRPIGMHHLTNYAFEYTPVGGELYSSLQDVNLVGIAQTCPARLDDMVNLINQGSPAMAQEVFAHPNMCSIWYSQDITGLFVLPGAAIGMYFSIPKERRTKTVKAMYMSTTCAVIFTGFAEPLEFMFVFASPILYGVHVLLMSTFAIIPDLLTSIFGEYMFSWRWFGLVNLVASGFLQVGFVLGRWFEIFLWLAVGLGIAAIYAVVFKVLITRFNILIFGREPEDGSEIVEGTQPSGPVGGAGVNEGRLDGIIKALGGKDNIEEIGNCFTRLRVQCKDNSLIDSNKNTWMKLGAIGIVVPDSGEMQAIYGARVEAIKNQLVEHYDSLA